MTVLHSLPSASKMVHPVQKSFTSLLRDNEVTHTFLTSAAARAFSIEPVLREIVCQMENDDDIPFFAKVNCTAFTAAIPRLYERWSVTPRILSGPDPLDSKRQYLPFPFSQSQVIPFARSAAFRAIKQVNVGSTALLHINCIGILGMRGRDDISWMDLLNVDVLEMSLYDSVEAQYCRCTQALRPRNLFIKQSSDTFPLDTRPANVWDAQGCKIHILAAPNFVDAKLPVPPFSGSAIIFVHFKHHSRPVSAISIIKKISIAIQSCAQASFVIVGADVLSLIEEGTLDPTATIKSGIYRRMTMLQDQGSSDRIETWLRKSLRFMTRQDFLGSEDADFDEIRRWYEPLWGELTVMERRDIEDKRRLARRRA